MNEKTINDILEASKNEIQQVLIEKVKERVVQDFHWNISDRVSRITSDFVENEMADDIKKLLIEQKPLILEQLNKAMIDIAGMLGRKMLEVATKNLTLSYKSEEIIKSIFD